MLPATEAQLKNITVKSDQLEKLMTSKIDEVRLLKGTRDEMEREVNSLRTRLKEIEGRYSTVQSDLDAKTASLKSVADEYNRAQLLKKKYHNTLAELKGCPRVVIKLREPTHNDNYPSGGHPPGAVRHDWGAVCVADPCTINVPTKSKSFVFDSVITPDDPQTGLDMFNQVNGSGIIHDVLHGCNSTLFSFGPKNSGKTTALLGQGNSDSQGLIDVFISQLFGAMEQNDVDCFTIKAQMIELNNDAIYDLFADPSQTTEQAPHYEILRDDKGRVHIPGLQQVNVNKAQQLHQLFHWGLKSKRKRSQVETRVGASHLLFTCTIENYSKKGDFRRARLTFVDLAGATNTPDNQWIIRSHQALGDVISVLSTAVQQRHHQVQQEISRQVCYSFI